MITLVIIFIIYNIIIYTKGTSNNTPLMSAQAIKGEKLYQENNCTACHQFYGLGGYLGPDLTNVISAKNKGAEYVKAFLNSGVKTMPKFNFTEEEKEAIAQFLTEVDQTGYYPIIEADKKASGWVDMKYKNQ
jgi:nitric oxide reductase subunit C